MLICQCRVVIFQLDLSKLMMPIDTTFLTPIELGVGMSLGLAVGEDGGPFMGLDVGKVKSRSCK